MIPRLRLRPGRFLTSLGRRRQGQEPAVVKGRMRNIIVVKPPDERFQEVLFILKDDYLAGDGEARSALLQQAEEIARRYTAAAAPPVRRPGRRWLWLLPPAAGLLALGLHLLGLF